MRNGVSRRRFLVGSGAALAVANTGPVRAQLGANNKITVGLIGCGGQGTNDARTFLTVGGGNPVVIAALADPDQRHRDDFADFLHKKENIRPDAYKDFRSLLDRKDIDVVIIGTPDHWHAICTILACQAGKDVYVEKPCSHNVREGRAMVNAARKHKRIVQVGQQQRSDEHFREAIDFLQNKKPLGTISRTLTLNYSNESPDGIGTPPDSDPPTGVDYDMWLGPAPKRPFNPNRFHSTFRWFYDYAAGMIGDWNVHLHDIVHWGMGVDAPISVCAMGGKRVLKDNRDTPDMMDVLYEYLGFTQLYTMGKCYDRGRYPNGYGTEFFGTDGSLFIDRAGWEMHPRVGSAQANDPNQPGIIKRVARVPGVKRTGGDSVRPHIRNFLECVRSRKVEDQHCDIEVGHRTATVCHLGNISLRVGRRIYWDSKQEIITHQDGTPDTQANVWLTREYRKGYELPEV